MKEILQERDFRKYVFWAVVVVLIVLSYFMLKPYLIALISAFILAYLSKPIYDKIKPILGDKVSAFVCTIIVILVIVVPLGLVVGGLTKQAYYYAVGDSFKNFLDSLLENDFVEKLGLKISTEHIDSWGKQALGFLVSLLSPLLSRLVSFVIVLFITLLGMYVFLVNWNYLAINLKDYIPFKEKDKITKELSQATKGIVYGTLLVGLIEFAVAGIGFYIFGVDSYLLLASIIFFSAFIPGIGPGIVWVPLALFYLIIGNFAAMIGIIVIGLLISFGIDTFLRTKILGGKTQINWFIMLLGILGGVSVFGLFGFIIGPLILLYTIKLLQERVKS